MIEVKKPSSCSNGKALALAVTSFFTAGAAPLSADSRQQRDLDSTQHSSFVDESLPARFLGDRDVTGRSVLEREATLTRWDSESLSSEFSKALRLLNASDEQQAEVLERLQVADAEEDSATFLKQLLYACAATDVRMEVLRESLQSSSVQEVADASAFLDDQATPSLLRQIGTLARGEWLTHRQMYLEAQQILDDLKPEESPVPDLLLFHALNAEHRIVQDDPARLGHAFELADWLIHDVEDAPIRYVRMAGLIVQDLKQFQKSAEGPSLDRVARHMTHSSSRLDNGDCSEETREIQQRAIDELTELIEKIENEQQQQASQQQSPTNGQGGSQADSALEDSEIGGGVSGEGDADAKNLKNRKAWGNLPPTERHEALQQISRDLPTHYRDAIEAYFRKMATDKNR